MEEAIWLSSHGADAVIAQGTKAGGHRGMLLTEDLCSQSGTFALLPQIVDAIRIPVIAAGGIASAREIRSAMSLGASGVQIGIAFMLCHEAGTSPLHRNALKAAAANSTAITNLFTGHPARGILNRLMKELGPMNALMPPFPFASNAIAQLRKQTEDQGNIDFSPLWAEQNTSECKEVSASNLIEEFTHVFSKDE